MSSKSSLRSSDHNKNQENIDKDSIPMRIEFIKSLLDGKELNSLVNYDEGDFTKHFYKIPDDKRDVKVLHGEKITSECDKIIVYLKKLEENGYFKS